MSEASCIILCLSPSGIEFSSLDLSRVEVHLGRPCIIRCRVKSTGSPLVVPPEVKWYRDRIYNLKNESLSEYIPLGSDDWQVKTPYPRVSTCKQYGDTYNCDVNITACHRGYLGRYRCDVTNKVDHTTISRIVKVNGMHNHSVLYLLFS